MLQRAAWVCRVVIVLIGVTVLAGAPAYGGATSGETKADVAEAGRVARTAARAITKAMKAGTKAMTADLKRLAADVRSGVVAASDAPDRLLGIVDEVEGETFGNVSTAALLWRDNQAVRRLQGAAHPAVLRGGGGPVDAAAAIIEGARAKSVKKVGAAVSAVVAAAAQHDVCMTARYDGCPYEETLDDDPWADVVAGVGSQDGEVHVVQCHGGFLALGAVALVLAGKDITREALYPGARADDCGRASVLDLPPGRWTCTPELREGEGGVLARGCPFELGVPATAPAGGGGDDVTATAVRTLRIDGAPVSGASVSGVQLSFGEDTGNVLEVVVTIENPSGVLVTVSAFLPQGVAPTPGAFVDLATPYDFIDPGASVVFTPDNFVSNYVAGEGAGQVRVTFGAAGSTPGTVDVVVTTDGLVLTKLGGGTATLDLRAEIEATDVEAVGTVGR